MQPFGRNRNGPKFGEKSWSPASTMWPGPRPTSLPSVILIHPAVWPQWTWSKIGEVYICYTVVIVWVFRSFMNNEILCLLAPFAVVQQYSAQLGVTRWELWGPNSNDFIRCSKHYSIKWWRTDVDSSSSWLDSAVSNTSQWDWFAFPKGNVLRNRTAFS